MSIILCSRKTETNVTEKASRSALVQSDQAQVTDTPHGGAHGRALDKEKFGSGHMAVSPGRVKNLGKTLETKSARGVSNPRGPNTRISESRETLGPQSQNIRCADIDAAVDQVGSHLEIAIQILSWSCSCG